MNAPSIVEQFLAVNGLIEHDVQQGTPEWDALRLYLDGSSESAAMLGLSKKVMRTELLRMKSTGIAKEYSAWVIQHIFEPGHELEASARPIIEKQIGRSLYPVTYSRGRISASCDGLTADGNLAWEHKQWNIELAEAVRNKALPDTHMPQCQQILLVTGAEKLIFTVSDGTEENMVSMEILPDRAWFERIILGWSQFNKERENYQHVEAAPVAIGVAIKDLPAVTYEINGLSVVSNIETEVKPAVLALIEKYKRKPETDQDFADLDSFNKKARDAVKRSEAVRATFKARFVDIDSFERALVELEGLLTKAAIEGEKKFKDEKDNRKAQILNGGKQKYAEHLAALQAEITGIRLIITEPDWVKAVHGLKTLDSYRNAVNTCLANATITADQSAKDIRDKLAWHKEATDGGYITLFPDLQQIIAKPMEDFKLTITSRIEAHKKSEAEKLEAAKQRIEAEAKAKAEREAAAKLAEEEERIRAEERKKTADKLLAEIAEAKAGSDQRDPSPMAPASSSPSNNVCQFKPSRPSDKELIEFAEQKFGVSFDVFFEWVSETRERMKQAA